MRTYFVFACVFAAAFAATQFIAPNSSQVGYLGRFDHSDPLSVKFDWSGVAVSLSFVGNSVSILLKVSLGYKNCSCLSKFRMWATGMIYTLTVL